MNKTIYVEGHRGFCALYPENTMLSFRKALELGVDAVEFDVWLSSDKVPVLMHDVDTTRTCGVSGHLRDRTFAEIKALCPSYPGKFGDTFAGQVEVPALTELLALVQEHNQNFSPELDAQPAHGPRYCRLGVEIKEYTEETVDLTIAALTEYGFDIRTDCWFYAFNGRIIRYLKEKYGARTMGYPDIQMGEFGGYDWYDEIGLSMTFVKSELCRFYVDKGMPVHMYCADNEKDVQLCLASGADLITANDPRDLLRIIRG